MNIKHALRQMLWPLGYDIRRFSPATHPLARRKALLDRHAVDIVLDVGANIGQFATELRSDLGYRGGIVSFEPTTAAFRQLKARSDRDKNWIAFNCALGDTESSSPMHLSANSVSSSILEMLPAHLQAAPQSIYVDTETVQVRTLDSKFAELCPRGSRVYLKMDTQGFEGRVLAGAKSSLPFIGLIQVEMPLLPLYRGELSFIELHENLINQGFQLISLEPGYCESTTGHMVQVDGIYSRAVA